jgi:hypothetical protein
MSLSEDILARSTLISVAYQLLIKYIMRDWTETQRTKFLEVFAEKVLTVLNSQA